MKTTPNNAKLLRGLLLGTLIAVSVAFAQDDVLASGKKIFQETAGGVGCAYCHGPEARGDGVAGLAAPNIVGAQMPAIRSSLRGGVPAMSFIKLSDEEHAAHHATTFVAWRAPSPSGIQPTGDEVHA